MSLLKIVLVEKQAECASAVPDLSLSNKFTEVSLENIWSECAQHKQESGVGAGEMTGGR